MSSYQKTSRSSFSAQRDESILVGVADTGRVGLSEKNHDKRVVVLLFIIPIWTFLFTALPVLISFQGVLADLYSKSCRLDYQDQENQSLKKREMIFLKPCYHFYRIRRTDCWSSLILFPFPVCECVCR